MKKHSKKYIVNKFIQFKLYNKNFVCQESITEILLKKSLIKYIFPGILKTFKKSFLKFIYFEFKILNLSNFINNTRIKIFCFNNYIFKNNVEILKYKKKDLMIVKKIKKLKNFFIFLFIKVIL